MSALSPLQFVEQEFEHPTIKGGLLFFNGLREVDLRLPGFGHHIAALLASPAKAQMSRGGSAALARALEAAARAAGGEIRLMTEPRRILVEGGRAVGIETAEGEVIRARHLVASSLNPHQTFLDLIDPASVPRDIRDRAQRFQYNLLAPLFALHLNLREPPRYRASADHPELAQAFMVIMGLDHVDQFGDIVRHHEAGTIPPTVMWGACPTVFDPSQAPPGRHTAFMWEKLPYRVHGDPDNWDRLRDEHGGVMRELWQQHAPNLADAVIDSFTRSPLDVERCLPNMREGDLLVGAFANDQVGFHRPFAGAGAYRTHLPALYLCGSSSHPGGNITGLPAYNAAQVILADLGLAADWMPAPIAPRLARDVRRSLGRCSAAEMIASLRIVACSRNLPCRSHPPSVLATCGLAQRMGKYRLLYAMIPAHRLQDRWCAGYPSGHCGAPRRDAAGPALRRIGWHAAC